MLALKINTGLTECGTDEAGRGCLAGPVTAAAVILPDNFSHPWLNDSKQLSLKKRELLRTLILEESLDHAVAHVMMEDIDRINILNASIRAMHEAINLLSPQPDFIAVDGNRFKPYGSTPYQCVIKGDSKYQHIAAASILAKTTRDRYMSTIDALHPEYGWRQNQGYPTKAHRAAIEQFGPTPFHRMSFRLLPDP
ncbi:MAG: ribonuclease HII [Flavobacteriaceae bacterium]|jgi:ribonuclease HII|nr:ribonuclease HII [Flavobacteriaceae bacterium]MDG1064201.1 ribonuclease HII [Flavobacteriaceae bacterium]MDG1962498.1 ribonuclease HII [Flavobacteriaceae bacterium]